MCFKKTLYLYGWDLVIVEVIWLYWNLFHVEETSLGSSELWDVIQWKSLRLWSSVLLRWAVAQLILMGHKHAGNISLHHYICSYLDGVILRRCFYQIWMSQLNLISPWIVFLVLRRPVLTSLRIIVSSDSCIYLTGVVSSVVHCLLL